jgi:hypothetical protein
MQYHIYKKKPTIFDGGFPVSSRDQLSDENGLIAAGPAKSGCKQKPLPQSEC